MRLDTTPPRPRVTSIGPAKDTVPRPELLPIPGGGDAIVHLFAPGQKKKILLFKTGPGPTRQVGPPVPLDDGATEWRWTGQTRDGRPVSAGTYLVAIEARDQAGNIGTSPPLDRRGLPAITYGAPLPGHGGITVRYLGVQPPASPAQAGEPVAFVVDRAASAGRTRSGASGRTRSSRAAGTPGAGSSGSPRRAASPASTSSRCAPGRGT